MTKKEEFLRARQELKVIESHLVELVAESNNEILQNLMLDFMSQRNRVNELYVEFLSELLKDKL